MTSGYISLKNKDNVASASDEMQTNAVKRRVENYYNQVPRGGNKRASPTDPPVQRNATKCHGSKEMLYHRSKSLYITIRVCRRHRLFLLQFLSVFFVELVYRGHGLLDLKVCGILQVCAGFWTERLGSSNTIVEHA